MSESVLKKDGETTPQKNVIAWIFSAVVFLLPILFIPSVLFPFQVYKASTLFIGVIAAVIIFAVTKLKFPKLAIPSLLSISAAIVPVVYLIAEYVHSGYRQFVGPGFDVHNGFIIGAAFLFLLLTIASFKNNKSVLYGYIAFFASFAVVAVYHLARLFIGSYVWMLGMPGDAIMNTIGKWNDLAVYLGLGVILAHITLEFVSLSKVLKNSLYIVSAVALCMIAINGFTAVWVAIGIVALLLFTYGYVDTKKVQASEKGYTSYFSIILMVLAALFVVAGPTVNGILNAKLNIVSIEARPSFSATYAIVKDSLTSHPFFGLGQNGFMYEWVKFKPDAINQTVFWNTDFLYGIGLLPTLLVTSGIVGVLPWIIFLVLYVLFGLKLLRTKGGAHFTRYVAISSFLGSLYLWVFMIIYIPSIVTLVLTFFFTGIAIATMYQQKVIAERPLEINKSTQLRFVYALSLLVLIFVTVGFTYFVGKRVAATYFAQKSLVEAQLNGNVDQALLMIVNAINLDPTDQNFRILTQLEDAKISQVISQTKDQQSEAFQKQLQAMLTQTIANAQQAVALDPQNYANYIALGDLYASLIPIPQSYENAAASYNKALELSPKDPAIKLSLARLELLNKQVPNAEKYIDEAIKLKADYADAIFLLAQIEVSQGDMKNAIAHMEVLATLNPTDATMYYQLGVLKYNAQDYDGAVGALEQAVEISPTYSNAKYFLALSYSKLGRVNDAIVQFQDLKKLNPDNKDIDSMLQNLQQGKPPVVDASAASSATTTAPVAASKKTKAK